nr:MAG TPA: hypothetical protein [Caudoviricetes sp.]
MSFFFSDYNLYLFLFQIKIRHNFDVLMSILMNICYSIS